MGVKLGFSGTGWIAKLHARMAQGLPDVDLAAVANHRPGSMQAFAAEFGIPRQYGTVEAMLADGGVDGLIVCTPNYLHAPQTITALKAGVPVMVEKPMAMTADEAEIMLEAAAALPVAASTAHCRPLSTAAAAPMRRCWALSLPLQQPAVRSASSRLRPQT
jgi:predicted dehydrogenase